MWRILHFLFGWDYVAWRNSADRGIARVHVDGMGRVFYWRYKSTRLADFITEPERVIWLTCGSEKYIRTCLERPPGKPVGPPLRTRETMGGNQ
jgi:hypothetical protein